MFGTRISNCFLWQIILLDKTVIPLKFQDEHIGMMLEIQGDESDDFQSDILHKEDCMAEVYVILRVFSVEWIIYDSENESSTIYRYLWQVF